MKEGIGVISDTAHGLYSMSDGNQLCNQCIQLCVCGCVFSAMDDGNCSPG